MPLTLDPAALEKLSPLAGVAVPAEVSHGKTSFEEALLFTHRGLSGPSILQISSYWREGDAIRLKLEPGRDIAALLKQAKQKNGRQSPQTALSEILPKRLAQHVVEQSGLTGHLADMSDKALAKLAGEVQDWQIKPAGSEGYRTAEVTLGGVDTTGLDSRSMAAKSVPGFISSANAWTSPAGSAVITSSGPGPQGRRQANLRETACLNTLLTGAESS